MSESMMWVQAIGFIGMALGVYSFQPKRRNNILRFQLLSNLFWVIHFSLLGATTGAGLNAVGGIRAYVFNCYAQSKHRPLWLLFLFMALMILVAIVTWQGPMSLLPMSGMLIATVAFWQRNEQKIRLILLFASPLWLIYNVLSGSYAGVATECFAILSILLALYRHRAQGFVRPAVQKST